MINRECGVYKTTYQADMALFPIPLQRYTIYALLIFGLLVFPFIANDYWLGAIAVPFLIWSLAALGLNLLTGYAGQISIGHAAFMAVGAYTGVILSANYGWPVWAGILAGGANAALIGAFFGVPSLRIKGFYLAIATLAAQFIIPWSINRVIPYIGGAQGQMRSAVGASIYAPSLTIFGWNVDTQFERYYFTLIIVGVLTLFAMNLVRSRIGRAWMAVRDRDIAAEIIGVNIFQYKVLAFAVSSFYAGIAGALSSFVYYGIANYEQFTLTQSIEVLAMIIIGGLGSILGSFFGAGFVVFLPIFLDRLFSFISNATGVTMSTAFLAEMKLMVFGGLIILFLVVEPYGLAKLFKNFRDYFRLWPFSY